jgi:predicted transcriptional regulator
MKGARDEVIAILSRLPEDASLEDIRYEFETIFGILEGGRDIEEGRVFTHEEVMAEVQAMLDAWKADKPAILPAPPS